jgi:hypothetical protein
MAQSVIQEARVQVFGQTLRQLICQSYIQGCIQRENHSLWQAVRQTASLSVNQSAPLLNFLF